METDLFAGIPVNDLVAATSWYESLFGAPPAFRPNDTEAVWEVGPHQYVYVVIDAGHAGNALVTVIASDFDARIAGIAQRGLSPSLEEAYDNGMRKTTFTDVDGNQIAFGGGPSKSA